MSFEISKGVIASFLASQASAIQIPKFNARFAQAVAAGLVGRELPARVGWAEGWRSVGPGAKAKGNAQWGKAIADSRSHGRGELGDAPGL